jgi:anti-sigma factor RsiW
MDRHRIDDDHLVARYLAGQLDPTESAAFEAHYAQDPATVREIERVLRLKEGLAVLRERGELDSLLRERSYWRPAMGLAAGILVLIVGAWLWIGQTTVSPIASTLAALSDRQGQPLHIASTHVLVKTRGPATLLGIPLPDRRSAIELRMIPSARPEDGAFRVRLGQLDAANAIVPLGETHARASAEDGVVVAYVDSAKLSRGRYAIELEPERALSTAPDRFIVELR